MNSLSSDEGLLGDAVVGGLMVLEAEVRDLVAERDEEVIRAVVARLVQRAGFADELRELVDVLLRERRCLRGRRRRGRGSASGVTSAARGISRNQRPARTGESMSCSRETVLKVPVNVRFRRFPTLLSSKRGSKLPVGREFDRRRDHHIAGLHARAGIDDNRVPAQQREVGAGGAPAEKPCAAAVARKSILMSSFVTPAGTVMW